MDLANFLMALFEQIDRHARCRSWKDEQMELYDAMRSTFAARDFTDDEMESLLAEEEREVEKKYKFNSLYVMLTILGINVF